MTVVGPRPAGLCPASNLAAYHSVRDVIKGLDAPWTSDRSRGAAAPCFAAAAWRERRSMGSPPTVVRLFYPAAARQPAARSPASSRSASPREPQHSTYGLRCSAPRWMLDCFGWPRGAPVASADRCSASACDSSAARACSRSSRSAAMRCSALRLATRSRSLRMACESADRSASTSPFRPSLSVDIEARSAGGADFPPLLRSPSSSVP